MHETGTVTRLESNNAVVRVTPGEQCGSCPARGGCHGDLDLALTSRNHNIIAVNSVGAGVGDRVEVSIPERLRLKAGLVVFVLPVLLAVGGAIVGSLFGSDLATGIGAGTGLLAGILGAVVLDRSMDRRPGLQFQVSKILGRETAGECH